MLQEKGRLFAFVFAAFALCWATDIMAQAPNAVTLQSVLRDATGRLVANRDISVRISLKRGSASGTQVYQETHAPRTNQNGLYTVFFGQGTPVSGTFEDIDWSNGPYYATVEADPDGGNSYTLTISHPIVSVPYALYAEEANERQVLTIGHDTIYLTGGSWVKLPALGGGGSDSLAQAANRKVDSLIRVSCIATVHYVTQSACDEYTWTVTGEKLTGTRVYQYVREKGNKKGCDSIEMLNLTINRSTHNVENHTVTGFLTWHGKAYATSGTYTHEYNNTYGCASVDTLKLIVNTPGALPGEFSVSATKKVKFSRGNLQYQASSNNWRFAEHQYDVIKNTYGNTNSSDAANTYWMDLFAWGTSGHQVQSDANNLYYRPWNYTNYGTVNTSYNYFGYGPSINVGSGDLTGAGAINDWGVSNAIANGGNQIGKWRVLTAAEWNYLFSTRATNYGRFCFARITGIQWLRGDGAVMASNYAVNGIILFPDNYVHPTNEGVAEINNKNDFRRYFTDNVISAFGWSAMEAAGAVFLPAGGVREANTVYNYEQTYMYENNESSRDYNDWGRYWTATHLNERIAVCVWFYTNRLMPNYSYNNNNYNENSWTDNNTPNMIPNRNIYHYRFIPYRYRGYSVRLIQDIN